MGKDFISVRVNGGNLRKEYDKITRRGTSKIMSASEEKYFFVFPDFSEVSDVDIGSSGTDLDIIQLKNTGWIEVER